EVLVELVGELLGFLVGLEDAVLAGSVPDRPEVGAADDRHGDALLLVDDGGVGVLADQALPDLGHPLFTDLGLHALILHPLPPSFLRFSRAASQMPSPQDCPYSRADSRAKALNSRTSAGLTTLACSMPVFVS